MSQATILTFEVIKDSFKTISTNGGQNTAQTTLCREVNKGFIASAISYLYRGKTCHCNQFTFKEGMKITTAEKVESTFKNGKRFNRISHFVLAEEQELLGVKPVTETKPVEEDLAVKKVKVKSTVEVKAESVAIDLNDEGSHVADEDAAVLAIDNGYDATYGGIMKVLNKRHFDDERERSHKNTRRHGRADKWAECFAANCVDD